MAHLDTHEGRNEVEAVRVVTRQLVHVQRAQTMLVAAGIAAFGIVAVAATMMTTLL